MYGKTRPVPHKKWGKNQKIAPLPSNQITVDPISLNCKIGAFLLTYAVLTLYIVYYEMKFTTITYLTMMQLMNVLYKTYCKQMKS